MTRLSKLNYTMDEMKIKNGLVFMSMAFVFLTIPVAHYFSTSLSGTHALLKRQAFILY